MPIRTFSAGEVLTAADTNSYLVNNVAQTVQTVKTDTFTTTSTTYTDLTGLSVSITPKSSTSKVLVTVTLHGATTDGTVSSRGFWQIVRGSTAIGIGDAAGTRAQATGSLSTFNTGSTSLALGSTVAYLDSPATTSATTYKVQVRVGGGTMFINRAELDTDATSWGRFISSITVQEISV